MVALPSRLRLSIAELDLVARAADLDGFPGLPLVPANPAADGEVLDGLRARGIVEGQRDERRLREDVSLLLTAILECEVSMEFDVATAGDALGVVVHLHEEMAVIQRAHDGLVSLVVVLAGELPAILLSLCGEDPTALLPEPQADGVRLTPAQLAAAERGEGEAAARLAGYAQSAAAPQRAGRVATRGTLYGQPLASCAWVAGPGGTYVLHERDAGLEIVRADGSALVDELLSLTVAPR